MLIKKILLLLFVTTTTMSYGAEKASIEISLRKTQDSIIYIASPIKGITLGFTDTLYVTEGKKVNKQMINRLFTARRNILQCYRRTRQKLFGMFRLWG